MRFQYAHTVLGAILALFCLFQTSNCDLLSYLSFEDTTPTNIWTGVCPRIPNLPLVPVSGAGNITIGVSGEGMTLNGVLDLGDWHLSQNGQRAMTLALWLKVAPGGLTVGGEYGLITLRPASQIAQSDDYGTNTAFSWALVLTNVANYGLNLGYDIRFVDNTTVNGTVSGNLININPLRNDPIYSDWTHFCMTYDGGIITLFQNGSIISQLLPPDGFSDYIELDGGNIYLNTYTVNPLEGEIDEVRIYNHALSPEEVEDLYTLTDLNTPPIVAIDGPNVVNVTVTTDPDFNATATYSDLQSGEGNLTHAWNVVSNKGCSVTSFRGDPTASNLLQVAFDTILDGLVFEFDVSDGNLCNSATLTVNILGSKPSILHDPAANETTRYLTQDFLVPLDVSGFPPPLYAWYQLTEKNVTTDGVHYNLTDVWIQIPNQFKSVLQFPNASAANNNTQIRAVLSNVLGKATSPSYTLKVIDAFPPTPTPTDGDGGVVTSGSSSTNLGLILGLALGIGGCCCLLFIILIIIIILLFVRAKRAGSAGKVKLYDPDYEDIAYGALQNKNQNLDSNQAKDIKKLEEILIEENQTKDNQIDFILPRILCDQCKATESESISKALTYIFASHDSARNLINFFVTREVDKSSKKGTLFRSNSIATKMFNSYARIIAINYIYHQFALPVGELDLMAKASDKSGGGSDIEDNSNSISLTGPVMLEVDPSKMDEAEDDQVNTLQLWLIAQKLFSSLAKTSHSIPVDIKQILRHVYNEVIKKFSEEEAYKAMGAFFFLRFVCPALMAPQLYGLLKNPPHSIAQRQLVLLAKVMQNLANDTLPGKKEGYMARLDDFITSNQSALKKFYDIIISSADTRLFLSNVGINGSPKVPDNVSVNSLGILHQQITSTWDKVFPAVQQENEALAEELQEAVDAIGDVEY